MLAFLLDFTCVCKVIDKCLLHHIFSNNIVVQAVLGRTRLLVIKKLDVHTPCVVDLH